MAQAKILFKNSSNYKQNCKYFIGCPKHIFIKQNSQISQYKKKPILKYVKKYIRKIFENKKIYLNAKVRRRIAVMLV